MNLEIDLSKIDILNLEWPNSDRDLHIVMPVLIYLQKKYKISFETKSIFNGYYYLLKYRPKLLLISNFGGAQINHEIVKLAHQLGIRVVTLISEGNVKEAAVEEFLWGWNRDKVLYVDKMLLWSKRSEDIFLLKYPNLKERLVTTGATGFDRYKVLDFITKEKFLATEKLKYKKIIGIAAWGFDHFFGDYYEVNKENYLKTYPQQQIDMHREDLFKLQDIYKKLIEQNRDTLFILRYHPGTMDFEKNEFFDLQKYENVFISNTHQNNHYQISDLISISDLWIGYETTTALESWLLGKETFLINPTTSNFIRENVYKGSPIVQNRSEAQELINEFFMTGMMESFSKLETERKKIIKDVIEYGDGKNHQRAAKEVMKIYNQPDKKVMYGFRVYIEACKQLLKIILSKTVMKKRWPELHYKSNFAQPYKKIYFDAITDV